MNGNWLMIVIVLIVLSLVARCDLAQTLQAKSVDARRSAETEGR